MKLRYMFFEYGKIYLYKKANKVFFWLLKLVSFCFSFFKVSKTNVFNCAVAFCKNDSLKRQDPSFHIIFSGKFTSKPPLCVLDPVFLVTSKHIEWGLFIYLFIHLLQFMAQKMFINNNVYYIKKTSRFTHFSYIHRLYSEPVGTSSIKPLQGFA